MSERPDLIVTWPAHCDYPLWRAQVERDREHWGTVFVVFSNHHARRDMRAFVRSTFDAEFLDAPLVGGEDWRDRAVNAALDRSKARSVLFTEQDFFYETLPSLDTNAGVRAGEGRWHPCFLYAARADIDRTSRDFGISEYGDHFARFGRELDPQPLNLGDDWYWHMQGLSEGQYQLTTTGEVMFEPEQFARYLRLALDCGVMLDPEWQREAEDYLLRCSG